MARGKPLSEDARRIVLNLHRSRLLIVHLLAEVAGVSRATIHRLAAQYEHSGGLSQCGMRTGRPRLLEYADTQVRLPL